MIVKEFFRTREDGVNLYRTYSNIGYMIQNENGDIYEEAVDIETSTHTYTETNTPIEDEISDEEALNIILGRENHEPDEGDGDQA